MINPKFVAVVLLASLTLIATVQSQKVTECWLDRFNGENNGTIEDDYAQAIGVDSIGNVYVCGISFQQVQSNLFSPRFATLKIQPDGNREWVEFWRPGGGSFAASANVLGIDADDNVIVAGAAFGSDDWGIIKYDSTGSQLWTTIYEANSTFLTRPEDIFVDGDGNSYLTGNVGSFLNPNFGAVVKIDSQGNTLWVAEYYGPSFDGASGNAVVVDSVGNTYLAGSAAVSGFSAQAALVKFDTNGNLDWQRTDGSFFQFAGDRFQDIAIDGDGNVVVVGTFGFNTAEGSDIAVSKYNPSGDLIWSELYNGSFRSDQGVALAIDSNNDIVVVGSTEFDINDLDSVILKFNTNGNLVWSTVLAGDGAGVDFPRDVKLDNEDSVYFTGVEEPFSGVDFQVTGKLDPDGNLVWKQLYGGPDQCCSTGEAIVVDDNNRAIALGTSFATGNDSDFVTICYQQENPIILGDLNRDGSVNLLDVQPFVDLLATGEYQAEGDTNQDGQLNLLDVASFIELISGK